MSPIAASPTAADKHSPSAGHLPAKQRADESFKSQSLSLHPLDQVAQLYPIIPGRLYFTAHWSLDQTRLAIDSHKSRYYFSTHYHDCYQKIACDFGPVNLSSVYWFCQKVDEKMTDPRLEKRPLVYYCEMDSEKLSNMAFLLGSYMMLVHGWSPARAAKPFESFDMFSTPFVPFRDASDGPSTFKLKLRDCLRGIMRAQEEGWFDLEKFDIDSYELLDSTARADCHQIANKFFAFRGPADESDSAYTFTPQHYASIFKEHGVDAVIRLNEADSYDEKPFLDAGMVFYDLFFEDCTIPPSETLQRFLQICDRHQGKIAIHCAAGMGRTGTLIAFYIMYHYRLSAGEAIGYVRICRPGSVIGPQQHFLQRMQGLVAVSDPADVFKKVEKGEKCVKGPTFLIATGEDSTSEEDAVISEELAFQIGAPNPIREGNNAPLRAVRRAASFGIQRPDTVGHSHTEAFRSKS